MQPEKRVRVMLPVRLQREADAPPRRKISACTFDISEHGARIAGLQETFANGEVLFVERASKRAKYKVVWMGKPGTPLGGHAGLQLLEGQESIWDVEIAELQEEYEPIIVDEGLIPTHREATFAPGKAKVKVPAADGQTEGHLVQLSEHECTLLLDREYPRNSTVALFISGEGFDLRCRGIVRAYASGHLIVDLNEIRRGDRRLFDYLFTIGDQA